MPMRCSCYQWRQPEHYGESNRQGNFQSKKVMCRIYDPIREQTYHELGMDTMCPTTIGAQMFFDALLKAK